MKLMPKRCNDAFSVAGNASRARDASHRTAIFAACLSLALATSATSKGMASPAASNWTGTWAIAQMPDKSGKTFTNQTLRQIVRISVGGERVRLKISNVFGTQPLRIEDVHLARRQSGSSIIASSDRQLRFEGHEKVV